MNRTLCLVALVVLGACGGDGGTNPPPPPPPAPPPSPPTVVSAVALSSTSVRVTFSEDILGTSVLTNGSQFTFDNGLTASAAADATDATVTVTTSAQTAATAYTVTVASTVTDLQGTALGTPNSAIFTGYEAPASLRINELNANIGSGCDLIELRVIAGGSTAGMTIRERTGGSGELNLALPTMTVATNDIIVIHLNSGSATCNPNSATDETTSPTQQPVVTYGRNYDTAYDLWSSDAGLSNTDNVITLFDGTDAITDAVFVSDDPAGTTTAAATETAAAAVGVANQWSPAMATYIDAVFRQNAVDDLDATSMSNTGTSIQRLDDTDDNNTADWTSGAGVAHTWGLINVGQTPL